MVGTLLRGHIVLTTAVATKVLSDALSSLLPMKRSADALSSTATGEKDVRCTYVIALSVETRKSWPSVLDTLRRKHPRAHALIYKQLADVVEKLQKLKPSSLAIIARPTEAGKQFVKDVHEITCRLDPTNAFTGDVRFITGQRGERACDGGREHAARDQECRQWECRRCRFGRVRGRRGFQCLYRATAH